MVRFRLAVGRAREENGIALVLAVGVLLVLAVMVTAVIEYSSADARDASLSNARQKAYALAEAGVSTGAAALAADGSPDIWSSHPTEASPATLTYSGGTVSWWAGCSTSSGSSCTLWRITAQSTVNNPTGPAAAAVHRTVSIGMKVLSQAQNSAWAYLYSNGDVNLSGGVFVQEPLYVVGNLIMSGNVEVALAASPLNVKGSVSQQNGNYIGIPTTTLSQAVTSTATSLYANTAGFPSTGMFKLDGEVLTYGAVSGTQFNSATRGAARTTAAAHASGASLDGRLAQIHIAGSCSLAGVTGACDPAHRVYGVSVDSTPEQIDKPVANTTIETWYQNAMPGPNHSTCTTGSVPYSFDNNLTLNHSLSAVDLTASTYDCKILEGGVTVGEIGYNTSTHVLTVVGTVFFDSDIKTSNDAVFNAGSPGATIWTSGQITIGGGKNFCGTFITGTTDCNFNTWSPQTNALALISSAPPPGATYAAKNTLTMSGGSQVQGLYYVDGLFNASGGSLVQGSVIANSMTLSGGSGAPSPGNFQLPAGAPAAKSVVFETGTYSG